MMIVAVQCLDDLTRVEICDSNCAILGHTNQVPAILKQARLARTAC
jgi:hypothetical protein